MDYIATILINKRERIIGRIKHFSVSPCDPFYVVSLHPPTDRLRGIRLYIDDESALIELINSLRASYDRLLERRGIKK